MSLRSFYPEEIGKRHGANEHSPRSWDIKVRKNEMKLRKKDRADALSGMRSLMALSRKLSNSSVEILKYPARKRKILRKFHFILPKFYFILPKFYFVPPWRILVFSLEIFNFLGRNWNQQSCKSSYRVALYRFVARI